MSFLRESQRRNFCWSATFYVRFSLGLLACQLLEEEFVSEVRSCMVYIYNKQQIALRAC
jgi:hypothetical protein